MLKRKFHQKRRECDQEITVSAIEKAVKSCKTISYPVMIFCLRNFIKLLIKYLKQTYVSSTLKFANWERCREACDRHVYPVCAKKETERT